MSQAGTLDIESANPQIPTSFITDDGTAIPLGNILEVVGGEGIETSASGNTLVITNTGVELDIETSNATPQFVDIAGTETLDFGLNNLVLGTSLSSLTVGTSNVGMGEDVFLNLTEGSSNVAIGNQSMDSLTTGSNNVGVGRNTLTVITGSVQNTAVGVSALQQLTTSTGSNTAVGYSALNVITTGTANTALGEAAGGSLTSSDSSNICIKNSGTPGDNNTIRLGTQGIGVGQQNRCFIAGITGVTVGNTQLVSIDSTTGQLGVESIISGTSIIGTENQVLANGTSGIEQTGTVTLTTPQDIGTTSTPTFSRVFTDIGSAAAPGFSFTGQTNYGMYYASNQTFLAANGTGWFFVTSGGIAQSTSELRAGGILSNNAGRRFRYTDITSAGINNVTTSSHWNSYTNTAARTSRLPQTGMNAGHVFITQDGSFNAATNPITTDVNGGVKTINGMTSLEQKSNGASMLVGYDGTNFNILASHRMYSTALGRIVDPNGDGDFTTLAAASAAATTGQTIFIRAGTYTENFTPKNGVSYFAYNNENVIIVGKLSVSVTTTISFSGIRFQTNSDFILEITGTDSASLTFTNCYFNVTNNTAFSCSATAGTQNITIKDCLANLGTTGITYFAFSRGNVAILNSNFDNLGLSVTASTFSNASSLNFYCSKFRCPITASDSSSVTLNYVKMRIGAGYNATCLTLNNSGSKELEHLILESGTASCVSVGSGVTAEIYNSTIDSSNTNAITGAGTLKYSGLVFTNTSSTINTTTQTAAICRPGITRSSHQPAFLATGGAVNNITGNSGTYFLGASAVMTEIFDQNGDFTVGNGAGTAATFTAPYTGKYYLEINIRTTGFVASTNSNYRIVTTARTYIGYAFNPVNVSSSGAGIIGGFSVLADMTAGDTATFGFTATGEASNICDVTDSFVSGYLVC